jgi:hypothetical protein
MIYILDFLKVILVGTIAWLPFLFFSLEYNFKNYEDGQIKPVIKIIHDKQAPVTVLASTTVINSSGVIPTAEEIKKLKDNCDGLQKLINNGANQLSDFGNENIPPPVAAANAVSWRVSVDNFLSNNLPDYVSEFDLVAPPGFGEYEMVTESITRRNLVMDYNKNLNEIKELRKIKRELKCR